MSEPRLTYESVLEMFRETDRLMKEQRADFDRTLREQKAESDREFARSKAEFNRRSKRLDRKISALGSRIGEIVESMVRGHIVDKFKALDYEITQFHRNTFFENKKLGIRGEIDLFLEDGEIAILIEVKTTLETADVRRHIERIENYRRCADVRGDTRRFVGAVAGAVVEEEAMHFAHEIGMYVIVQSGKAVEIVPVPKDFRAKEW
jgi:hypothetical protein